MKLNLRLLPLLLAPLFLAPTPAEARPETLRSWVRSQRARQTYGLYMLGRKVGFMTMEFKLARAGKSQRAPEIALVSTNATLRVRRTSGEPDLLLEQEHRFSLAGQGALQRALLRTVENGKPTSLVLEPVSSRTPTKFALSTWSGGKQTVRAVPTPRETLGQTRLMMQWLASRPANGAQFSYWATSLDSTDFNSREVMVFRGHKRIAWGGVPSTVYDVTMRSRGMDFNALLRPNGMFVRGQMGGLIEVRAEDERAARDLSKGGVDLLAASLIRVDRKLGAPWNLSSLTLEARGVSGLKIPASPRQRVTQNGNVWTISMRPDAPGNAVQVLSPQDKRKYLRATTSVQSDDAGLKKLAKSIVGADRAPLAKAAKLVRWVYGGLAKSMDDNASTALQVLANKKGDCTEHALLFTTLARAAGVPAREVSGLAYIETPEPMFGWHAWAEIHDGHEWITMDPTWNQVRVDASHIKFSHDMDDFAWTGAIGRLKLRVVDAR